MNRGPMTNDSAMTLRSRLLLGTAFATSAFLGGYRGYIRRAYAQCAGAGGTYSCSGSLTTAQGLSGIPLTVTTNPGFTITTLVGNAFTLTGIDGLTFTDNNGSTITGANYGIRGANFNSGALSITTTGAVTGGTSNGIVGQNNTGATDLTINAADVSGGVYGILATQFGTGTLSITTSGTVTGTTNSGIYARNDPTGTGLTIDAVDVSGGTRGIDARQYGSGALSITTTGAVTGSNGHGIYARNAAGAGLTIEAVDVSGGTNGIFVRHYGAGELDITASGTVAGTTGAGIFARNDSGTNLTIEAVDVSGGAYGILALHYGTGALAITTTGTVAGLSFDGIYARNYSPDLTIEAAAVSGGTNGIYARHYGTGALSITATGTVAGTNGSGIWAATYSGTDLTINAVDVSGGSSTYGGIFAKQYGTGALSITTTGTVTGTSGAGIDATAFNGTDLTIAAADVSGNIGIRATNDGSGALAITTSGTVTGTGGRGIRAVNQGTDLTVTTVIGSTVIGQSAGIYAANYGSGATTIVARGDVTSNTARAIEAGTYDNGIGLTIITGGEVQGATDGIRALNRAYGELTVAVYGNVSASTGIGISATNVDGTDLNLTTAADTTVSGGTAIDARNNIGVLTIRTDGDLVGTSAEGLLTRNYGTDLIVTTNGGVTGGSFAGIDANNFGTGILSITVNGDVSSSAGDGIYARRPSGGVVEITVGATGAVTNAGGDADDYGIEIIGGAGDVTIAGTLNGGGGALLFADFANRLELQTGAVISGNAIGGADDDTLALQGAGLGTLNVGQILNFELGTKDGSGEWALTGTNAAALDFAVNDGLLTVNGTMANTAFAVNNGAVLGGTGTVGTTDVAGGGTLAPGTSPGTLNVAGNLTLSAGAILDYELGDPNGTAGVDSDLINVSTNLMLDGTLNVLDAGGFGLGVYRLINYGGSLTDNGLDIGLAPAGFQASDLTVQTSVASEINLVVSAATALSFWDGGNTVANGAIDGGSGVWNLATTNWTNVGGTANGAYDPNVLLVFQATPGTITVDNGAGAVSTVGMQFAADGHTISGDPLALGGAVVMVRVGDGTSAGANYTATIASNLIGSGTLEKTDLGTLILTGTNSYTGGTTIAGGTLQLGNGGTSGSIAGDVLNNGVLAFNRSDTFTMAGKISGSGAVEQIGTGTTVLTGDNDYTGGTTIRDGTLQVSADANLGAATGGLFIDGGTLHTTGSFTSARTINVGIEGTLLAGAGTTLTLTGSVSGNGSFVKDGDGAIVIAGDGSGFTGTTSVEDGTLSVNGSLCGDVNVLSGGRLQGTGTVCDSNNFDGGTVAPGNSIGTLTVAGDYVGTGGTLEIETVLGGDASPTDRLVVTGDTSGPTDIRVINVGGAGGQTVAGIKIIDIGGTSGGTFTLLGDFVFQGEQAVVGGAYAYTLHKNGIATPGDGDWYLRSALTDPDDPDDPDPGPLYAPGVPLYEAYAGVLQTFNELGTLQQRVGNRSWGGGATPEGADVPELGPVEGNGIWARIEAAHAEIDPETSTTGADYDATLWKLQAGLDGLLHESETGQLIGGVTVHYGTVSSDVSSIFGTGSIDATGYGVGGTLTWYGNSGFYVDGQAQATWYDSDLTSDTLGIDLADGNDGFGYALGIEAGQKIVLDPNWSLTPQAQLAYSSVDFDDFADPFGAAVSLDSSDGLVGRLGVSADYKSAWQDAGGQLNRSHVYAIANLYYDFLDGSDVDVAGIALTSENQALWGGLGIGGSLNFADDRYSIFGEALATTSLEDFGDSNIISGKLGFRVKW